MIYTEEKNNLRLLGIIVEALKNKPKNATLSFKGGGRVVTGLTIAVISKPHPTANDAVKLLKIIEANNDSLGLHIITE